ncbi:Ras-related and estrogen-regulated growth inhibitor-like protein [Papilio xuthus]|uniref:small monomeric GTPase n=1 Tax=Papilio xuthus TaxID=66420 RepID=A0A194PUC1_PAPXU|nr:Ras-related and estrogen-regulated growth inhibitor-like protein [Papilio xuthus]
MSECQVSEEDVVDRAKWERLIGKADPSTFFMGLRLVWESVKIVISIMFQGNSERQLFVINLLGYRWLCDILQNGTSESTARQGGSIPRKDKNGTLIGFPLTLLSVHFLYQHRVAFDGAVSEVEILDTSNCAIRGCIGDHVRWGDAFAVVYSVCERRSFVAAAELLSLLVRSRLPGCAAITLLGNKRDLEHAREVHAEEGQELSLRFGCQFYEVSAAESCAGAALAFHALLREARALALLLPTPRRKLAAYSVSKVIGTIFGKNSKSVRKKRPSLSI